MELRSCRKTLYEAAVQLLKAYGESVVTRGEGHSGNYLLAPVQGGLKFFPLLLLGLLKTVSGFLLLDTSIAGMHPLMTGAV